jgi:hypothetical protein
MLSPTATTRLVNAPGFASDRYEDGGRPIKDHHGAVWNDELARSPRLS